jgi:hypothetical protein
MNSRSQATNLTELREAALVKHLNGDLVMENELALFPCSEEDFASLIPAVLASEPSFREAEKAGGLGNHKDLQLLCSDKRKGVELKVSNRHLTSTLLEWQPWEGGVQFLQGQVISKTMSRFLGSCGTPMVAAWFEKVKVLMATHLPSFVVPTYEDYRKLLFTIGSEKKLTTPAAKLIQELRAKEPLRNVFQAAWLLFEDEWFLSHAPNLEAFQDLLKEVLGQKDYWININKGGAFLIEGFNVVGLDYVGTAKKPEGGSVFRYKIKLQKKLRGDVKEVPIVLKFYWKNGGQGVQNINLLVVSDTFA